MEHRSNSHLLPCQLTLQYALSIRGWEKNPKLQKTKTKQQNHWATRYLKRQKGQKAKGWVRWASTTAHSHNKTEKGWERNTQSKGYPFSKQKKPRMLKFGTIITQPQRKIPSITAGQQSRNEFNKEHIFFTNTCSFSNDQHTTDSLFKKSLLKRSCVRDCLLHIQWTPKGRVAQSKLSLFANQIQSSSPHPLAINGNSGADPLTHVKAIPHSQSSTFFSSYLLCLFNTYNSRNK